MNRYTPTMKFTAVITGTTTSGIPVPDEVVEALGAGKRPKVVVTVGCHTYRSSIMPWHGDNMISLSAANREAAGVANGEVVEVTVELDTAPREVKVPADLATALAAAPTAKAAFEKLSFSNQRRIVESVEGTKVAETRLRRIDKALAELSGR